MRNSISSILERGGLLSDAKMEQSGVESVGIAHQHIKERRARRSVPVCRQGTLADYVPFYFGPRSPMLYAIHRGAVEGYDDGQRSILHLTSAAELVVQSGLPFAFTEGHAEIAFSELFDDLEFLNTIDWVVMASHYWNDTNTDSDRKRRRQAEFLVHDFFPWTLVTGIGVIGSRMASEVGAALRQSDHQPEVVVESGWYPCPLKRVQVEC